MDILLRSFSNKIFLWSVRNKNLVIRAFISTHILQVINILAAAFFVSQIPSGNTIGVLYYDLGGKFGTLAALAFLVTITPGIAKRFGFHHPKLNFIQTFRRHFGIATFLLVLTHYSILRLIPYMSWQTFTMPPLRELIGFAAYCMFFVMFITSNDFSTNRLGRWWGKVHSLAYVIVWLMFVHIALYNPTEPTAILVGFYALAEWASLIYFWVKKKPAPPANIGPTQISPDASPPSSNQPSQPTRSTI